MKTVKTAVDLAVGEIVYTFWIHLNPSHLLGKISLTKSWAKSYCRDVEKSPRCWPLKSSVQEHWRTPYFLRQQLINAEEAKDSFELWFSLQGGGALSHADVPC